MEAAEIVEYIAIGNEDESLFDMLRPTHFADLRRRAVLSHYEGNVRLLFAVLTLAVRDWLSCKKRLDEWMPRLDDSGRRARNGGVVERRHFRLRLREVEEWLFTDGLGGGYTFEMCAEVLHFDTSAFRKALRGLLEKQRETGVLGVNLELNLVLASEGKMTGSTKGWMAPVAPWRCSCGTVNSRRSCWSCRKRRPKATAARNIPLAKGRKP